MKKRLHFNKSKSRDIEREENLALRYLIESHFSLTIKVKVKTFLLTAMNKNL